MPETVAWRPSSSTWVTGLRRAAPAQPAVQQRLRRVGGREEDREEHALLHQRPGLLGAEGHRHEHAPQRGHGAEAGGGHVERDQSGDPAGEVGAEGQADEQHHGRGHHRPRDRAEDRAEHQQRPGHGRDEQPVEPALLDVAREVRAGGRTGEPGALQAGERHDPRQVGVRREAVEAGQARELAAHAEQEDDRGDRRGQQGAAHARDLVERAQPQRARDAQHLGADRGAHVRRRRSARANVARAVAPTARPTAASRPSSGSPSAGSSCEQRAHALDHVGQRVERRDRLQRGRQQLAREERGRGEQQHEDERERPTASATSIRCGSRSCRPGRRCPRRSARSARRRRARRGCRRGSARRRPAR